MPSALRTLCWKIAVLGTAIPLVACSPAGDNILPWNESGILLRGQAFPRDVPVEPVYCYSTIGWIDCYKMPQIGAERRRVGLPHVGHPQQGMSR